MPVKDLSKTHHRVSELFPWPETGDQWTEYELPAEKISFFRKNGFVSGIRMLDNEQIDLLRKELADVSNPKHEGHELFMSSTPTSPLILLLYYFMPWVPGASCRVFMMYYGTQGFWLLPVS